jgi:hypothetical protein
MAAIMEYKLDENADDIIWLRQKDGAVEVILEVGGVWKLPEETKDAIFDHQPADLFNSQHMITGTRLSRKVLFAWKQAGRPRIKEVGKPTPEYCRNMTWAPEPVLTYYRKVSVTPDIGQMVVRIFLTDQDSDES